MDDLTEEELRQIVSGGIVRTGSGYMYQPQFESVQMGQGEEGGRYEPGELQSILKYKEGQTAPGQAYDILDPKTKKLTGTGAFKKPGNLGSMLKEAAIDLGPLFLAALGMPGAGSLGSIIGSSVAGGLGVTGLSAAQIAALGSTVGGAGLGLAQGQDPLDVLKNAALAGASAFLPSQVSSFLPSTGTKALDAAIKAATEIGTRTAIQGGDVEKAVLGSLMSSGFGAATGATGIDPKLINTAIQVARSGGDPQKLYSAVLGYARGAEKGPTAGQAASAGYGGAETSGFFDPEAEDINSYIQSLINAEEALPKDVNKPGAYYGAEPDQEKYADEDRLLGKYPAPPQVVDPKTTMSPNDMNKFLEANIDDPGTIETIMQDYFPDLYRQTVTTTGQLKKDDTGFTPGRSIRDVGPVTQIKPGEKLEGTDIKEPDLSLNLPTVPGGGKTKKPSAEELHKQAISALLEMQRKRPEQEKYELFSARPFGYDLMYGLEG